MPFITPPPVHIEIASTVPTCPLGKETEKLFVLPKTQQVNTVDPYAEIKVTPKAAAAIGAMAENLANLIPDEKFLREKGKEFDGVHVLRVIEEFLTEPNIKHIRTMRNRLGPKFHWNGFLWGNARGKKGHDGFGGALTKITDRGEIQQYLPGFAKKMNIDLQLLEGYVEKRDWGAFFDYFLRPKVEDEES
jgi:hypothetical protein